ncbi:hydantoinase B/oxoprolinase family protein [Alteribacillus iranensis]|uniref:5-oxoprolinase (ATP-hydrolysing)/N-methylhydantoinase B n=1 Tax=Alteribacillus iranensis TaxID=930128 RepID=A0A1I2DJ84_9BACI|nr:hydantoinase B/oxoprolinase family protein [Alteribacillus iranensis]SFE80586.1 5-oxoprolinase (ATP-hydrolysing)/N-methylhydantoinase B [Alteribacillus iranensis]
MTTNHIPSTQLDPITFEVLRRSFEYTCERMSLVLKKASFSPIIYDMVDFSNAIFDNNVELIGQTANCPVHIAAMHFSARASLEKFPVNELGPDDVIMLNDPYNGGTHTNDVTMTMPIFYDGELLGFAVSRAHWTDVGGGFDTHVIGEGLSLSPLMVYKGGEPNTDLINIIKNNSRTPHYVEGDIQAQMGALQAAKNELTRLADKYGIDVVRQGMRETLDYTQKMTKNAISQLPDGEYEASDYIESDGFTDDPVRIKIKLTVNGDRIGVDFTGSSPATIGPINSPYANTASAVYYSLKFFLNPEAPANAGMYRQIDINIPEGTWMNPTWPSPVLGCTTASSSKVTSAIWLALAEAIPDDIVAPTCSDANWYTASVTDPETNETHVFSDLPAGGWGGTPASDGMHVTMDPLGNCQNLPAEVAEVLFPVRHNGFEMRTDSAGAGRFRGGVGVRTEIEFLGRGELIWMESSRTLEGSPGVNGGLHSAQQRQLLKKTDGSLKTIGGVAEDGTWYPQMLGGIRFQPGESFVFESTGGGGWGNPFERDPELVAKDVREDIVSKEKAAHLYGVILTEDLEVDIEATKEKRKVTSNES